MAESPRYRRNPGVTETEVDGEIFLVEPETQEVFYLDAGGAALWRLLAEPLSLSDALAVYGAAFPDADAETIRRDLEEAVRTLFRRGLIVAAS
jgi:hypothetical protein